ncbi:MAG: SusC/RagA family TonB-linked outer membrane protein [Bacteroidales bacterium]|nr:SusC/RagA family TonB-linked outer membrane protein [Bacteroidales bacterium]
MKRNLIRVLTAIAALSLSLSAWAQNHTISGQVLDSSDGQPVIGAGVAASTGGGTITDYDGKYVISVPAGATLTFSNIGYISHEEKADGRTVINVSLTPDTESLEELVVLGYTSQKKTELSSAVVSISGDKLADVTTPDVGNMLQGKVAGVVVMNSSGQPGSSADIRIRGTGSITAGAGPLYVVDGVAGGSFNPNDIETLTVLKDASATALYGAAASGGVIVVTTKSAKSDKATVNFRASAGIKKALTGRFKPMDAYEAYDFMSEIYDATNLTKQAPKYENLADYNFDWIGNTFKTGVVQDYYLSTTGKAGKVGYYVSLDHYDEDGSFINSGYVRNAARINLSAPITERLTMNVRVNYSKSNTDYANSTTREAAYVMLPFDIPYVVNESGVTKDPIFISSQSRGDKHLRWYSAVKYNVLYGEQYNYSRGHDEGLTGDIQLVWNLTDWLTFTTTNRYDSSNSFSETYTDARVNDEGNLSNSEGEWNGWGTTNLLKAHKSFRAHDFNAIVGWEYGEGYSRSLGASGSKLPIGQRSLSNVPDAALITDPETGIASAADYKTVSGQDYQTRSWALLSQVQYSYLGKYIFTGSLRYDESSKFGPLNRGGFFPGASGAWIMSNEDFLKGSSFFSFLKMRAGYGKTGNDNIPNFKYQDIFTLSSSYNGETAAFVKQAANYNLGWEEAYMASLGFDATIKNNVEVTLDLYNTINSNLLFDSPMPPSSGFFAVTSNVGKVRNRGVEIAVNGTLLKKNGFVWDGGINLGANQNRVLELPEHKPKVVGGSASANQIIRENGEIYAWYMPKWLGVGPETGRPLWEHIITQEDIDNSVTYEADGYNYDSADYNVGDAIPVGSHDDATAQVVGSASPWFTGGLNTSLSWKGITLSANGSFVVGNKVYNATRQLIMDTDGAKAGYNQQSFDNGLGWVRWVDGDPYGTNYKATHPEAMNGGNSESNKYSSRYLEDGSFFRLRNVTLSYDLPKNLVSKAKMSSARVYLSADNIFTYSRFSGMDPEVSLEGDTYSLAGLYSDNYPVPMSLVFGIDIKF